MPPRSRSDYVAEGYNVEKTTAELNSRQKAHVFTVYCYFFQCFFLYIFWLVLYCYVISGLRLWILDNLFTDLPKGAENTMDRISEQRQNFREKKKKK